MTTDVLIDTANQIGSAAILKSVIAEVPPPGLRVRKPWPYLVWAVLTVTIALIAILILLFTFVAFSGGPGDASYSLFFWIWFAAFVISLGITIPIAYQLGKVTTE